MKSGLYVSRTRLGRINRRIARLTNELSALQRLQDRLAGSLDRRRGRGTVPPGERAEAARAKHENGIQKARIPKRGETREERRNPVE